MKPRNIPSLDGLRGLSAGMVVAAHMNGVIAQKVPLRSFLALCVLGISGGKNLFCHQRRISRMPRLGSGLIGAPRRAHPGPVASHEGMAKERDADSILSTVDKSPLVCSQRGSQGSCARENARDPE